MNRGQLYLIDFQSMPDGIYKWIGHYQALKDIHNLRDLSNAQMETVNLRGQVLDPFTITTEVLQKDVLAPFLFIIL